ncbi:DUF2917 domain-containing protein [Burkholderia oklahomensis]|uniref:DUF2917 domain-containing protein n=1 Tax=Burkholderia oklahomensis TaxID=342113 RepID=UPI00016A9E2B|nr:DUF2917 domain-containing protein [Burkholderia oklahomensis]AJX32755.1 hypothetical protein BG90_745 [Burkholderia oklahomensis C6786]AOI46884.1 hypothetical protein WI23_14500 [Burkholderia oklahomensis C6786]KUY58461.1 hypothetical protein WI23_17835 [Burkholderia oklahomensis C6786]MBI0360451.1 DUF2917 domain-containing protein [Burkholderia oklahomensis]SUW59831.1 Protein of uncharacterised function (DUF2917) [Burkholderia oklahomensis]
MREIRAYVLDYREPAAVWRAARDATLRVTAGEAWLTVDGRRDDYWLAAGESFELPRGWRVWIGAGRGGARIEVSQAAVVGVQPVFRAIAMHVGAWWPARRRRGHAAWSTPT